MSLSEATQAAPKSLFTDPAALINPYPYYKELRANNPVYFDDALQMYVITKYEDIKTALSDAKLYSSGQALFTSYNFEETVNKILNEKAHGPFAEVLPMTDPPEHTRVRSLVNTAFSGPRVRKINDYIVQVTEELFAEFLEKGELEVVNDIATPLPVAIIASLLCVPRERSNDIKRWTEAYSACACNRLASEEEAIQAGEDLAEMQNFITAHLDERRANPGDDVLTDLINARTKDGDEPLSNAEILATCAAFLGAGHETSTVAITHAFRILAEHPEELTRLRTAEDLDTTSKQFCEELLRLEPPTRNTLRVVTEDVELSGVAIPKGSPLMILNGSANRDEEMFGEDADDFNFNRSNSRRHMAFGWGVHACIGNMLARAELNTVVQTIAKYMDKLDIQHDKRLPTDYHPVVMPLNLQPSKLPVGFSRG